MSVASAIATAAEMCVDAAPLSDRLVGTLVHRLLQRVGFTHSTDTIREVAVRLVRGEEIDESDGLDAVVDEAVAAYASICGRAEVRELYAAGRTLHEVPFTTTIDGRIVRGTVDCLVETAPDRFTLLEFKTGRPRPGHQAQLELYLRALRQAFPAATIDSRLIYTEKNAQFQLVRPN